VTADIPASAPAVRRQQSQAQCKRPPYTDAMQPDSPSRARFEDLVTEFNDVEGVTPPRGGRGFGRSALRCRGRIFAMLVRGALVVKLPADRVAALVAAGHGAHFDANKGTPMREWFAADPNSAISWSDLAAEALAFAGSQASNAGKSSERPA
jgi:hypothetical protein